MAETKRLSFRWATENDLNWLVKHDPHISRKLMKEKIARREMLIARKAGKPVGLLRYALFCDWIPFIIFLFVPEDQQKTGIGSQLVAFFEKQMRQLRFKQILVSSRSDGHSQHFWRKLGYSDIGSFKIPKEPFELLFHKHI